MDQFISKIELKCLLKGDKELPVKYLQSLSPAGVVNNTVTLVNIVQYILVRRDLLSHLEWPVGAVIAQACHASSAAIHLFYDDSVTQAYLKDLDNMHKVILEVPDEKELLSVEKVLQDKGIHFKKWIEQPENYPTCIALKPYEKNSVQKLLRKYKMFK